MKTRLCALISSGIILWVSSVMAQTTTTGAVKGVITDQATGDPVNGATVVMTSPSLQGTRAEITDDEGGFFVSSLPPGTYRMTVYYSDSQTTRSNVLVRLGKVAQVNMDINTQSSEIIEFEGRAPLIDQGSTKTGRTITEEFTQNIPTGSTFGAVLSSAAGSQDDLYGVSFGGATSAENVYIVEGINTTDPAEGLQSTNLPNEFIQETELITGGYNAEYGRSTGGVVNVLTKLGGNRFSGTVFLNLEPGFLRAAELLTPQEGSSIEGNRELAYDVNVGAELGGPIIKDRLWFHVGISPRFRQLNIHRIIQARVDDDMDGFADVDENFFPILNEVDRTTFDRNERTTFFTAKLTGAVSPEHQGSLSFLGNPSSGEGHIVSRFGSPIVTGTESATREKFEEGAYDLAGKWTSKFNNNKTQLDAVVGWHRNMDREYPSAPGGDGSRIIYGPSSSLLEYMRYEEAINGVPDACTHIPVSPDEDFVPCPVRDYRVGGRGIITPETMDRFSAKIDATQRVKALGQHIFKAGIDAELQAYERTITTTGGETFSLNAAGSVWTTRRYYRLLPQEAGSGPNTETCIINGQAIDCLHERTGLSSNTSTRNLAAYIQDSWQILPNLTVNYGLRWEQQQALVADELRDTTSALTGQPIQDTAFKIADMFAPRVGVIYDPTQEGRSKISAHWGRFYESIPMHINASSFGGSVININSIDVEHCSSETDPDTIQECQVDNARDRRNYYGAGEGIVLPNLGGQYIDDMVFSGEYELFDDFKVGATYIRRNLGRAIEDISTDGGTTYIIANPGDLSQSDADALRDQGVSIKPQLAQSFDRPSRLYNALQLTAEKRFSRALMVQASYTLSRTEGNYPGLFSPETGQLAPNLTSMYDLPELMANRTGPLAADRTHLVKVDGFYELNLDRIGYFVFGGSVRAASGIPNNYLGAHLYYGDGESYILPRGSTGRSPIATKFDVRLTYGRALSKGIQLEAFVDVVNLFNQQPEVGVDEEYTEDSVNPIVGGSEEDLKHLKRINESLGVEENRNVDVNPNFGNMDRRQLPLSMRFGMRLTF